MSQLSKVKDLVLKDERRAIKDLMLRSEDLEHRAHDIAEVMPRALELQTLDQQNKEALLGALSEPVAESVRDSMKRDPESFADALFPVLGPAIRKAASEAIRSLAERLNRTVEHSFSRRGLQWRWESLRTGTPMADLILRDTLIYRVEQIFLIERESGHLLTHVQDAETEAAQDSDAVSAMLTAIQDFVRDSFGAYEQTDLNTVQIGGRTVWIFYGPQLMLATVFYGAPNAGLRPEFHTVNEQIHRRYADELATGLTLTQEVLADLKAMLMPLLTSDSTGISETKKTDLSTYGRIIPLGIVLILVWYIGAWHQAREYAQKIDAFVAALKSIPGVVILDVSDRREPGRVSFLKDPSVELPDDIFSAHGLSSSELELLAYPFQSSAPQVLLAKIKTLLKVPASVSLRWENDTLVANGVSTSAWVEQFIALPFSWLGVEKVDYSGLKGIPAID